MAREPIDWYLVLLVTRLVAADAEGSRPEEDDQADEPDHASPAESVALAATDFRVDHLIGHDNLPCLHRDDGGLYSRGWCI